MTLFEPIFFSTVKPSDDNYVIENCITAYCLGIQSCHPVLRHDFSAIKNLLKECDSFHKMELLSVLFDFLYATRVPLTNIPNDQSSNVFILATRKLFAYGHFANQMLRQCDTEFIHNIPDLIICIINLFNRYQDIGVVASCSVGYALSSFSYKYREININSPNSAIYFELAELAVKFCHVPPTMPEQILRLFHTFFLFTLFSFPSDKPISTTHQNLFQNIIQKVMTALTASPDQNFNFIGLVTHLISFLNSEFYPMTIRYKIYNLINLVAHNYNITANFIFESTNLPIFAHFIADMIVFEPIDLNFEVVPKPTPTDVQPTVDQLMFTKIINVKTFSKPIPFMSTEQRNFAVQIDEPEIYTQRPLTKVLTAVLETTRSLCSSTTFQSVSLTNVQLIKALILHYGNRLSPPVLLFIIHWIKFVLNLSSSFSEGVKYMHEYGIFEFLIHNSFSKFRYLELINFTCEFFPYVLKRSPNDCHFLNPMFQYFEECVFLSTIESCFFRSICMCVTISPQSVFKVISTVQYDERIANLLLFLRLQHITAIESNSPFVNQIEKTRMAMFAYIDILLSFDDYSSFLFDSSKFMEALMQMIFEENLTTFVLGHLGIAISRLDARHPTLDAVFLFFQLIYASDNSLLQLKSSILETISSSLSFNTIELAKTFLKTNFFDTLISFVQSINDQANVYKLLELFRIFSQIRGEMRQYIAEADLFSKLYVLIKPFFEEHIDLLLLGNLWSIIFEDSKDDSVIREIKNASPLPLIFHLLEDNEKELLRFIQFLNDCCERDVSSALEVNSSDFPSHLVKFLFKYRKMHSVDKTFEQVSTLFTMLSLCSVKGKDLQSMLRLISELPGGFRPIFSMDIIRDLLSLYQTPIDAPPSFIHVSKSDDIIRDFPVGKTISLNDFAFFFDIEFSNEGDQAADILYIETSNNNFIRLVYSKKHILFFIHTNKETIKGDFDYQFVPKRWTQIVVQYAKRHLQLYVFGKDHASIAFSSDLELKGEIKSSYVAKGLMCNLGVFFLTKNALNPATIRLLCEFPRSFITTFSAKEKSEFPSEFAPLFEQMSRSTLCLFNSAVSYNSNIVNLASIGTMRTNAQIFRYLPQAKDVMHVVGGVQALLPLFDQLDMPTMPEEGQKVIYMFDPTLLPFLLQILYSMLQKSPENQQEFYQVNGFGILGYLLTRATMQHFSIQSIEMLRKILNMIEYWPLVEQMIEHIFLNARIWIYFPKELQKMIYESILVYLKKLENPKDKTNFVKFLPYSKVFHIMRVSFWSVETDKQICLYSGPKIDPITREETFRRSEDMESIRGTFWLIAKQIYNISFTKNDAKTLCTLCFDMTDVSLTVDTLTSLIMLIFEQNKLLIDVLKNDYTFNSFFTLLVSPSELIRAQCIHIFVRFLTLPEQDRLKLLNPFSSSEWMTGIISTISTVKTTTIFADVVFGYLFGFYPQEQFTPMPHGRVSKDDTNNGYTFVMPEFLPLAMLSISDFDEATALPYLLAILRSITASSTVVLSLKDWDHPFLMFLIHRNSDSQAKPDRASTVCLRVLSELYSQCKQLQQLQLYIAFFSARTHIDLSYISRLVFLEFINTILVQKQSSLPHQTIYDFYRIVFEFIFLIPNSDPYYLPDYTNAQPKKAQPITFKDLHQIKYNGDPPTISYTFATRTRYDGTWVDAGLADRFLYVLSRTPFLFSAKPSITTKEKQLHPLYMYSFTLGAGLQHQRYFSTFLNHIKPLTIMLPQKKLDNVYFESFVHFMAGLIRCARSTENAHQSHTLLYEYAQEYSNTINVHFEIKSAKGMTMSMFNDEIFKKHGFCHLILQKQASGEAMLADFSKKQTKNQAKIMTALALSNAHYAEKLDQLNIFQSSSDLSRRNDQLHYRLLEFSSQVRNGYYQLMKQYKNIWRMLSSEGGPWHRPESDLQHHYKLDCVVNSTYTRRRLRENFSYTDHKDASLLRDEGKSDDAHQKYNEHLKKLRISNFTGDMSVVQMGVRDNDDEIVENQLGRDDEVTLSAPAKLVTMKKLYSGTLMMTKQFIIFEGDSKYKRIPLSSLKQVFLRRYLLLDTSIEIYTTDFHSYFFDFVSGQRNQVLNMLKNSKLPNIEFIQMTIADVQKETKKCQSNWQKGKLSNFEYLMKLNILSGRTYNDLGQYPVFPWIIADYESPELDLTNPATFRDLSVPIGALDSERLGYLKEKMGRDPETHYLYGSFYSSSAVVIGYLIRVEPFTSLHIELQSGRFDLSDRLFHSIPSAWQSVHKAAMDFRELIPEFFYLPDFLENKNSFDLGRGDSKVELPPWATSATDFVLKNREALESDYVTQHLPEWIDLIFGVKSRGFESEKVDNLFSPFFFDSAITKEVLNDPDRLAFVQEYAACFGQAPSLLFNEPHSNKKSPLQRIVLSNPKISIINNTFKNPIVHINENNNFSVNDYTIVTSTYELFKTKTGNRTQLDCHAKVEPSDIQKLPHLISSYDGNNIAYSFPWENALYLNSLTDNNKSAIKRIHTRPITFVSSSKNYCATGSEDCTVVIMRYNNGNNNSSSDSNSNNNSNSSFEQHSILSKHHSPISCIAIDEDADLVVSCSKDGVIVVSTLLEGRYLRTTSCKGLGEPTGASISAIGNFAVCFTLADRNVIRVYDQNINLIGEKCIVGGLLHWCFFELHDGRSFVIQFLKNKTLILESVPNFETHWQEKNFNKDVIVMKLVKNPLSVMMGTRTGEVIQMSF